MEIFAINVLWLTSLLLPALLFAVADRFHSRLATMAVATLAIGAGWAFMLAYAVAAQSLTAKNLAQINGASLAFASTLGWALPTLIVAGTWVFSGYLRGRVDPNSSFKPTPLRGAP